jgi:hypothetical protein
MLFSSGIGSARAIEAEKRMQIATSDIMVVPVFLGVNQNSSQTD